MRNTRIDFLRALGLAMIILAHAGPPALVMQLRNFDVTLMVLISGISFGRSYHQEPFADYLWKRVKRLVFPVWIFLSIYFSAVALFDLPFETLTTSRVLGSYFLMDGIGFVWIIKVFLLVALAAPLIYRFHQRTVDNLIYFTVIAVAFVGYEAARILTSSYFESWPGKLVEPIGHYMIPYTLVFAIGLRLPSLKLEETLLGMNLCLSLFIVMAFFLAIQHGDLVPTQLHKYPPTLYYFSYGLSVALAAWLASGRICQLLERFTFVKSVTLFAAQNSIWIYLWHIPLIKIFQGPYFIKYVVMLFTACLITFIQVRAVDHLVPKVVKRTASQQKIKMLFTG